MMKPNQSSRFTKLQRDLPHAGALAIGGTLLLIGGCGTADPQGLCKPAKNSGYVAATHDPWGDPWKIDMPESLSVKCAANGETGQFKVPVVIRDSLNIAKAGVAINATVSGESSGGSGSVLALKAADVNTDSCGVAFFTISWACPASAGEQRGGTLTVFSGALMAQKPITIEHYTPPTALVEELDTWKRPPK